MSRGPDGELLVYDVRKDAGHVLNPSVGMVYEQADGTRSISEMAALLPEMVGLPADDEIVLLALQELDEAGLLDAPAAPADHGISRRQLITRLTLGAGAVALLPTLDSITGLSRASAQPGVGTASSTVNASGVYADMA